MKSASTHDSPEFKRLACISVGGMAQWLGFLSLAGGLSLTWVHVYG